MSVIMRLHCNDWVWIADDGGSYATHDHHKPGCPAFTGRGRNGRSEHLTGSATLEKTRIFPLNYRVHNRFQLLLQASFSPEKNMSIHYRDSVCFKKKPSPHTKPAMAPSRRCELHAYLNTQYQAQRYARRVLTVHERIHVESIDNAYHNPFSYPAIDTWILVFQQIYFVVIFPGQIEKISTIQSDGDPVEKLEFVGWLTARRLQLRIMLKGRAWGRSISN